MNRQPDLERVLHDYLADDGGSARDDVLGVLADRISRQPQRRSWPFPGRTTVTQFKLAAALAAAVVIAVVAYNLLPERASFGPQPTASPTPVVTALTSGKLAAGRYRTQPFGGANSSIALQFDVPAGWTGFAPWALLGPKGPGAPDGVGLAFLAPDRVFSDGCHWDLAGTGQWPQAGDLLLAAPTSSPARDLAATLAYVFNSSGGMHDVSVDGYQGRGMDIRLPADMDFGTCDRGAGQAAGAYFVFGSSDPSGAGLYVQGPGQVWHIWLLDVGSAPIVVLIDEYPGTSQVDKDAAQGIVASLRIDGPAPPSLLPSAATAPPFAATAAPLPSP